MKKDLLRHGFETIAFQNGNFGKELELYLQEIRDQNIPISQIKTDISNPVMTSIKNIEDTIFKYTGLKVVIGLNDFGANVNFHSIYNLNHIFLKDDQIKKMSIGVIKSVENLARNKTDFSVDIKKGIVGKNLGFIKNTILLDYSDFLLNKKYTIGEVTAILLHEVGHGVTSIEYMGRVLRTNQALATLYQENFADLSPEKLKIKLRLLSDYVDEKTNTFDDLNLNEIKDKESIATIFVDRVMVNKKSELGTPYYDTVSSEYLADQFVSRHGYTLELATVLQKIEGPFSSEHSKKSSAAMRMLQILLFASHISLGIAVTPLIPIVAAVAWVGSFIFKENTQPTYDTLKVRIKRVKEQLIQNIKLIDIPKEELNLLLAKYDQVEKIADDVQEHHSYLSKIYEYFSSAKKDKSRNIKLQRDLEELASNKLFVQSAKLRTMLT